MPAVPEPTTPAGHVLFFGLGYTALRLARRLKAAGWRVSGTVRDAGKAADLAAAEGVEIHVFDGAGPIAGESFTGVTHLVDSIPPGEAGAPPLVQHRAELRACPTLQWVGYLSTPAVYGDRSAAPRTKSAKHWSRQNRSTAAWRAPGCPAPASPPRRRLLLRPRPQLQRRR